MTKSIFSAKDARRIHQKDDAEEKDFITANTRSHRHCAIRSRFNCYQQKARSTSRHRTGRVGKGSAMLFCKLDDGFSCNSSIIATADVAFNRFQFEARGPIASAQHVSRQVKSTTSITRAHMKHGVKYEHSYSPVPHASRFRTMLALATAEDMLINHVDIN